VAKQFLDTSNVGTSVKQMGCKTVTQSVRANQMVQACPLDIFLDQNPQHFPGKNLSSPADKHPGGFDIGCHQLGSLFLEVSSDGSDGMTSQGDNPLFATFSGALDKS